MTERCACKCRCRCIYLHNMKVNRRLNFNVHLYKQGQCKKRINVTSVFSKNVSVRLMCIKAERVDSSFNNKVSQVTAQLQLGFRSVIQQNVFFTIHNQESSHKK